MFLNKSKKILSFFMIASCFIAAGNLLQVFQEPEEYVKSLVTDELEAAKTLWLDKEKQEIIADILGHPFKTLRIRYWVQGENTIWILEEIGKTEPITFGYLIEKEAIKQAKVLIFRESRGGEIHNDFFTKQLLDCTLTEKYKLSKKISGITGATLSVNAMKKTAALALYLNSVVKSKSE